MLIFITGFMGSGKSYFFSTWSAQSEALSFDFDHEIAKRVSIEPEQLGEWIEANGWQAFRSRERELLLEVLRLKEGIFSLGGGTLHSNKDLCFEIDRVGTRVWLDTPVDTCWERVEANTNRPLVRKGREEFYGLYNERLELYRSANISISGEASPPSFTEFCNKYRDLLKID